VISEDKKSFFKSDCWSCGKCIAACPNDVLAFAKNSGKEHHDNTKITTQKRVKTPLRCEIKKISDELQKSAISK